MIPRVQIDRLVAAAQRARKKAYAPYSQFSVGAALLTREGRIFSGCNVENATFGATLCAERSAVAAMVTAGHRDPLACAVVTGAVSPVAPCGICRQVLIEFAPDLTLVLASVDPRGRLKGKTKVELAALLPHAFQLEPGAKAPERRAAAHDEPDRIVHKIA